MTDCRREVPIPPTFAYRFKEDQPLPGALSFVRTSPAVRRTREGVLESVAANVLRYHYATDGEYLGVLIERAATNLFTHSRGLDSAAWSSDNTEVDADAWHGPFGDTWDKLVADANVTGHNHRSARSFTSGKKYCFSCFAKADEYDRIRLILPSAGFGTAVQIDFDLTNITATTLAGTPLQKGFDDYGGGIYRLWLSATATATGSGEIQLRMLDENGDYGEAGDGTKGINIDGFQLEEDRETPSSYIPCGASATTRASDDLDVDPTAFGWNDMGGWIYAEAATEEIVQSDAGILTARPDSGLRGLHFNFDTNSADISWRDDADTTSETSGYTFSRAGFQRAVVTYGPSGVNSSANGATEAGATPARSPDPITSIWLGRGAISGGSSSEQYLNGYLREIAYGPRELSTAELALISARGPVIGETLYQPNVNLSRWPRLSDYAPSDDAQDCTAAIKAMLADAADGASMYEFDSPYGARRTYRITDRGSSSDIFDLPNNCRAVWNAWTDFSDMGIDGGRRTLFQGASGGFGAEHDLLSRADPGDRAIRVGSSAAVNYVPGDIIRLSSDAYFSASTNMVRAEKLTVERVSGDYVYTVDAVRDTYLVGDSSKIEKMATWSGVIENPLVRGPGRFTSTDGDYGLVINFGRNVQITGGEIEYVDFNAVRLAHVIQSEVHGVNILHAYEGSGVNGTNQYGICVQAGCEFVDVVDNHVRGGKHGIVHGVGDGITRSCSFRGNDVRGTWHCGIAGHGDAAERMFITANIVEDCAGGIDMRSGRAVIHDNVLRNLKRSTSISVGSLGIGVYLRSYAYMCSVKNNVVENGIYGVRAQDFDIGPDYLDISDNRFHGLEQRGIDIDCGTDTTVHYGLNVTSNKIYDCAGHVIVIDGKFQSPIVKGNDVQGSGFRCIWLTGASAGNGPISPYVRGNTYRGHSAPLVQYDTGTSSVGDNVEVP